jgi:hypothetical protein
MGLFDFYPTPDYPAPPAAPALPAVDAPTETVVQVAYSPRAAVSAGKVLDVVPGLPLRFPVPANAVSVRFRIGPTETEAGTDPVAGWCAGIRRDQPREATLVPGEMVSVTPLWIASDAIPEDALRCEVAAVFGSK